MSSPDSQLPVAIRREITRLITENSAVATLGRTFAEAGHQVYLVGGPVRDLLLGRDSHDLDFTTSARPDEIERLLKTLTKAVWDIGRAFGTIGGQLRTSGGEPVTVEITTFRTDAYSEDSRKPAVAFGDALADDLIRRDFTVNAMAIDVVSGEFIDLHDGLSDIAHERLMTPFAPERSFSDDPLRMMRAARFASQLGFTPEAEVVSAMTTLADRIEIISAERVRDELTRLLLTDSPGVGLNLLVETGLAERVLPELPALRLETDEHHRHKDVYQHSLTVLDQAIALEKSRGHQPDLINRLAALLHDIGKPATRSFEADGRVTFHHHDVVGAKLARKRLQALRFSGEQIKSVATLVELHLRFHGYADGFTASSGGWSDAAVRRYVRDAGGELERLHMLTRSDCTTRNQRKATRLRLAYDDLEARIAELAAQEELNAIRPDLDGTQIMAHLGISPSREVGEAYNHLLTLRIENGPLGEERALSELDAWWQQRHAPDSGQPPTP